MIGVISREFEAEVGFHRGADVGRAGGVNAPTAVLVLVLDDPVGGFLEAGGVAGPEQRVEENVVGFQRGVGFEFAAPVAIIVLRGEEELAGGTDRGTDSISQTLDLAKAKLWSGTYSCVRGGFIHQLICSIIHHSPRLKWRFSL